MSKDLLCPECGKVVDFHPSQYNDVTPQTVIECGCGTEPVWGRVWWARFLFTLRVRREERLRDANIPELLLRREIFGKVLDGSKKSTSRKGKRDIKVGQRLRLKMTEDATQWVVVRVIRVVHLPFFAIGLKEAKKEGYSSVQELRDVLMRIYGTLLDDEPFTFIEWR